MMINAIDVTAEMFKALVRILEKDIPDLRQKIQADLLETADIHDARGEAKAAEEVRLLSKVQFLTGHRDSSDEGQH